MESVQAHPNPEDINHTCNVQGGNRGRLLPALSPAQTETSQQLLTLLSFLQSSPSPWLWEQNSRMAALPTPPGEHSLMRSPPLSGREAGQYVSIGNHPWDYITTLLSLSLSKVGRKMILAGASSTQTNPLKGNKTLGAFSVGLEGAKCCAVGRAM